METTQNNSFTSILPDEVKSMMSESTLNALAEYFENAVEAKVHDRVQLAVESARAIYDKEVDEKIKKLVIMMDESHKSMAVKATKALMENFKSRLESKYGKILKRRTKALLESQKRTIDRVHTNMAKKALGNVMAKCNTKVNKMRKQFNESVKSESNIFQKQLIESLSNYIDQRIDKVLPYSEISKAVKNTAATKVLESFKHVLEVSNAKKAAKKYFKKPIMEAASIIEETKKNNRILESRNARLKDALKTRNRDLYLESRLKGLSEDTKSFARRVLADKPLKWIKENFDYCIGLHKEQTEKARAVLQEHAMNQATSTIRRRGRVNVPRTALLETQMPNKNAARLDESEYDASVRNIIGEIIND